MNDHLFSLSQREQHTPVFALKCRIKVCPHCAARFLAHTGGYCHKANYAPFVAQHTSLVCEGGGGEREADFQRGVGGFEQG